MCHARSLRKKGRTDQPQLRSGLSGEIGLSLRTLTLPYRAVRARFEGTVFWRQMPASVVGGQVRKVKAGFLWV